MAKKTIPLTRPQLGLLARAALDNSAALLSDAKLLLACERWPRAHSLAVLAAEEFGKFYLCVTTGLRLENVDEDGWKSFWTTFSSHKPKFAKWFGQYVDEQEWGPVGSAGDEEWLRAWNSRQDKAVQHDHGKQAGFYVDFDLVTGEVRVPAKRFTQSEATRLVKMVASVVDPTLAGVPDDPERLVAPSPFMHALQEEIQTLRHLSPEEVDAALLALKAKYFGRTDEFPIRDTDQGG